MRKLRDYVGEMLEAAYREAGKHGRIVGRVSRYSEVRTEPGGRVRVEVDPEVYYTSEGPYRRLGDYLVIVDPKSLKGILARVTSVSRVDEVAGLGLEPPLSPYTGEPDPSSLLTTTYIEVEPLLEAPLEDGEPPTPVVSVIEPQSPVIDPREPLLERLLSLPGSGVALGALATPGGLVKHGRIPVRLPVKAFLQHVLIIGTTGSGKTTLMKNMAASMGSLNRPPLLVVIDLNQDFIQLPVEGEPLLEDPVYTGVYRGVKPPSKVLALTPVTMDMLKRVVEAGTVDLGGLTLALAERHYRDSLEPIAGPPSGWKAVYREGAPIAIGSRVIFVPYAINTMKLATESLLSLLPGLTSLSRETLRRIRERFHRIHGVYPPLQALYAAMIQYSDKTGGMGTDEMVDLLLSYILSETYSEAEVTTFNVEGLGMSLLDASSEVLGILRSVRPHGGSVEAIHRRIGALLDSGIADILVSIPPRGGGTGALKPLPEPQWETIAGIAVVEGAPVVVDLGWSATRGLGGMEGSRTAAYRILEALIAWRQRLWASRGVLDAPPVIVFIDEAHQFFPQERGPREEQEASRHIASMIARIARLGRARGLGLVFSTHSPRDLHDIILQLANTRIVLRTEKGHAERLDLPSDIAPLVPRLPDRVMVVASHVYREGYVIAQTSPPLTAHYDISARL